MKNKGLLLLSTLLLLGAFTSFEASSVKEGTIDVLGQQPGVSLKNLQVGANEEISVSPTYVQVGRRPSTNNYVLRFATAISGPVETATYTRIAEGLENNTKSVTTVYKGVSGKGVTYYYDGTNIVTEETEATKNYYWACYIVEYGSNEFVDTDFNVSLKIEDNKGASLTSQVKTTSLNTRLDNEEGIYKLTLKNMTFNDGTTYKYLAEGDSIEGLFSAPSVSGYSYNGLCEVGTVSNIVSYTKMPAKNITLAPVYERGYPCAGNAISSEYLGKINLGAYHSTWSATKLTSSKASVSYSSAIYNEKAGVYELVRNYKYSEGIEADSLFIAFNSNLTGGVVLDTRVTYTIQNQGSEAVQIRIGQTQSSGTPDDTTKYPTEVISLEPGEVKEVDIKLIKHNSFMTMVKFLNKLEKPFNIAMMCESAMSKLSLGKMKFNDGSKVKYLYESSDFSSYIPLSFGDLKYVGYLKDGSLNEVKYDSIVPAEDLNIMPIYDVESYATKLTTTQGGKYSLNEIHSKGRVGFDQNEIAGNSSTRTTATFNEELGCYEASRLFKKTGGVAVGDSFIVYTHGDLSLGGTASYLMNVESTNSYNPVFTFENKGSEAVEFTINQVNSSSNPQGDANMMKHIKTVSLEPGEVKDVTLTILYKDALLTYFKMTKATTTDFNVAGILRHHV